MDHRNRLDSQRWSVWAVGLFGLCLAVSSWRGLTTIATGSFGKPVISASVASIAPVAE